jgi:hypothetical protein
MMMEGDGELDAVVGGALDVAANGERDDRWRIRRGSSVKHSKY